MWTGHQRRAGGGSAACRPGARGRRARSAGRSSVATPARRRASRRPGAIVRRASEREPPNASAISCRAGGRSPRRRSMTSSSMSSGSLARDEHAVEARLGRRGGRLGPVEARHERARERALGVARRRRPPGGAVPSSRSYQLGIAASGIDSVLPYISSGGSVIPTWLPSDFDIFCDAVGARQQRHRQDDLRRLAVGGLDRPAHQQVERLVGAAELDVGVDRHRVVALEHRVEQLEQRDRLVRRRSAWRSRRARAAGRPSASRTSRNRSSIAHVEPLGVVAHLEPLVGAQHLARLVHVRARVGVDLLAGEHRPRGRAPARVARRARCSRRRSGRRCGRGPGTRAASGARRCGRGGGRAPSGRARASTRSGRPSPRRSSSAPGGQAVDRVAGEVAAVGRPRSRFCHPAQC